MRISVIVIGLCALSAVAWGDYVGPCVTIQVQTAGDSGSFEWPVPAKVLGKVPFELPPGLIILGTKGTKLLEVNTLNGELDGDPAVSLAFSVTAGAWDTAVTITSALVGFPAITNPDAYASASITVTDNNGNGATVTGLFTGMKSYEARANGAAWADLIDLVTALPNDSETGKGRRPVVSGAWETIPGAVSSIQAAYRFMLTAEDSASGTSRFEVVVPEPAVLALLAMGGLALLRRRRAT